MISIIIPANNEGDYITSCLESILASDEPSGSVQVVVAANGCTDDTAGKALSMASHFQKRGWKLDVLDLPGVGKIGALNAGDASSLYGMRAYLDADITLTAPLIAQLTAVLESEAAVFASGSLRIPRAQSYLSQRYARFWLRLPFVSDGVPGCGLFAVNAAGRSRWQEFPNVISDDTFVRYHFRESEMVATAASYFWPITEGLANLVRVRRRQDEGLEEIRRLYPELAKRVSPTAPGLRRMIELFLQDPLGFAIYSAVAIAVRLPIFRNRGRWDRGR